MTLIVKKTGTKNPNPQLPSDKTSTTATSLSNPADSQQTSYSLS